jgi:hypothetical protein
MSSMKKLVGAALALTAGAGIAIAANEHVVVGKIEHLNPRKHEFTVRHHVYRYNPRTTGQALRLGGAIKIHYRNAHGHRIAYDISPA